MKQGPELQRDQEISTGSGPGRGWRRLLRSRRFWAALLALLVAGGLLRSDLARDVAHLISIVLSEIM